MKRFALAMLLSATTLFAQATAAGNWIITGDVQGVAVDDECTITQTDTKLTGSCILMNKKYDVTGTVADKKITISHAGEYNGDPLTITYSGTLADDGTLSGTIDVQPMDAGGTFTAKKAVAEAAK